MICITSKHFHHCWKVEKKSSFSETFLKIFLEKIYFETVSQFLQLDTLKITLSHSYTLKKWFMRNLKIKCLHRNSFAHIPYQNTLASSLTIERVIYLWTLLIQIHIYVCNKCISAKFYRSQNKWLELWQFCRKSNSLILVEIELWQFCWAASTTIF